MDSQTALTPTGKLVGIGADMLGQLESTIADQRISGFRIKLGNRIVKEVPLPKASAIVTIAIALVAVLLSSLSVEVEHEPR